MADRDRGCEGRDNGGNASLSSSGRSCAGTCSAETHRAAGSMTPTIRHGRIVAVGPEVLAETLQEELDARGWTAADLARRGGCHVYWDGAGTGRR